MGKYTTKDDQVIIDKISKYPTNIDFACTEAAAELGRSRGGVLQRYYSTLKKGNPVTSLATTQGYVVNVKNTPIAKDTGEDLRMEIMMDILKKMNRNQKKQVLSIILNI